MRDITANEPVLASRGLQKSRGQFLDMKKNSLQRGHDHRGCCFPSVWLPAVPSSRESTQAMPEGMHSGSHVQVEPFMKLSLKIPCAREHSCGCTLWPGVTRKDPQQTELASRGGNFNQCNCTQVKEGTGKFSKLTLKLLLLKKDT